MLEGRRSEIKSSVFVDASLYCACAWSNYLVGSVTYTDVEVGEICFDDIAEKDFQSFLLGFALNSFGDFGCHSGVEFHGDDFLCFLKDLDC